MLSSFSISFGHRLQNYSDIVDSGESQTSSIVLGISELVGIASRGNGWEQVCIAKNGKCYTLYLLTAGYD